MPLTYVNSDNTYAVGYLHYPASFFADMALKRLEIIPTIAVELSVIPPSPDGTNFWLVYWSTFFFTPEISDQAQRFKSALPSFDLAAWTVTYRGSKTDSGYFNYLSNSLQTYYGYSDDPDPSYPYEFDPDWITGDESAFKEILRRNSQYTSGNILFFKPYPGLDTELSIWISYVANVYVI